MEMLERRESPESSCSDVVTRSDLSVGQSARYYLLLTFAGKSLSDEPESRDPLPTSHITRLLQDIGSLSADQSRGNELRNYNYCSTAVSN